MPSNELTPLLLRHVTKSPDLTSITHLTVSNRNIDRIGSALHRLTKNLTSLNVSFNRIRTIDSALPYSVFDLNLSNNRIETISTGSLPKVMGTLDLSNNQIKSLDFLENKFIVNLNLRNNPLSSDYRSRIIRSMPHIWSIDDTYITEEERTRVLKNSEVPDIATTTTTTSSLRHFQIQDVDTCSKYLDLFRHTPRKSKRTEYRLLKIRRLYENSHDIQPYPSSSQRCLEIASCLALLHGFDLVESTRREALEYLGAEWMSNMKGFVATAYMYDLLSSCSNTNHHRDKLIALACSRKCIGSRNPIGRIERLDEIRGTIPHLSLTLTHHSLTLTHTFFASSITGTQIELDRVLSRHDSRYALCIALKAILSVRSIRTLWDYGHIRDVAIYCLKIPGESIRKIGEQYRKSLIKRRPLKDDSHVTTTPSMAKKGHDELDEMTTKKTTRKHSSRQVTTSRLVSEEDETSFVGASRSMYSASRCSHISNSDIFISRDGGGSHGKTKTPFQQRKSNHPWYDIASGNAVSKYASSSFRRRKKRVHSSSRRSSPLSTSSPSSSYNEMSVASMSAVLSSASRKILNSRRGRS